MNKLFSIKAATGLVLSVLITSPSFAQDLNNEAIKLLEKDSNSEAVTTFNFGVPDSPALALSGLNASDTTKINQLQDFIVSLPDFSESGKVVAFDFNPANILAPINSLESTIQSYRAASYTHRLLRRTRVSLLARNGVNDSSNPSQSISSLLTLGFSASLLDKSDPLFTTVLDKDGNNLDGTQSKCEMFLDGINELLNEPPLQDLNTAAISIGNGLTELPLGVFIDDPVLSQRINIAAENINGANILMNSKKNHDVEIVVLIDGDTQKNVSNLRDAGNKLLVLLNDPTKGYRIDKAVSKSLSKAKDDCYDTIAETISFKPNLDVGGAILWNGTNNGFGDFESGGQALWASYRQPLLRNDQYKRYWVLGFTGRAGFEEFIATGDEATPTAKANTIQGWLGAEYFSNKWRLAGRYGYVDTNFQGTMNSQFSSSGDRWLLSGDLEVQSNIWLGVSYGQANGTTDALTGNLLKVNLTFQQPKALNIFDR